MPDMWMDVDATLAEVPINALPLIDDTDFKTREESLTYDQAGLDLVWNFLTPAGAFTQTAVTPTTGGGDYDWTAQGNGLYTIGIPSDSGASINNDTEGFGWFTGYATGVLPWRGPTIGFRDATLNDKLVESAWSATRGLAGTAVPDAAADAAGGLPISDAGGLDLDGLNTNVSDVLTDTGTTLPATLSTIAGYIDTEVAAILVDTGTTLDGKLDAIKAVTDALTAASAALLAISAGTMVTGTVDDVSFSPTTTEFEADDITEATADHYNGRRIIFTSGALAGQATSISDYVLSGANGHFTVVALTEAPANDVTFIIV